MNAKQIDLKSWKRYDQYEYFKTFREPFFNICSDVDVTNLKKFCVSNDLSFFIASAYILSRTVNCIDEFKYRLNDDGVICYDKIRVSCTILRNDKTFSFAFFNFIEDFELFYQKALETTNRIKKSTDFDTKANADDLVYTSILPWISFRSVEHPKREMKNDSIPRFAFGKLYEDREKIYMPVSVSPHHSLMDAYHVGEFFKIYQDYCTNANELIKINP